MSMFERAAQYEGDIELRRRIDGQERVPMLPLARLVAVAPGVDVEEPAYVWIEWAPGVVERPYPGSAIWRAALQHLLLRPPVGDLTDRAARLVIAACLERFPTLDTWLYWADHERAPATRPEAHRSIWRMPGPGVNWPW